MDFLKPADLPDNFTRSLYKIAPYRGCGHGCCYCDGRAERYYVEGDFEVDIVQRRDIPERLAADLPRIRERGMVAFGSGTTDPYQPLEAESRITGTCASLLAHASDVQEETALSGFSLGSGEVVESGHPPFPLPAMVMTKSSLALRDLPLWRTINERAGFLLMVSITSLDEGLRSIMEPGASSFSARIELLKAFKEAGCAVGVLAMPFLPGISDGDDSIRKLYAAVKEIGVDFVMPGGLTLRPGRQKELYLETLRRHWPELEADTRSLFSEDRPSGVPTKEACRGIEARLAAIQLESGLPWLLPHQVFARFLPSHDSFRLLLRDMVELYAAKGIQTSGLRQSAEAYDSWLLAKRREFRRARKLPASWLESCLPEAARSGELAALLDNDKLSRFASSVILDGARLNYTTLKLEA
jgi:DNA repair photolyase